MRQNLVIRKTRSGEWIMGSERFTTSFQLTTSDIYEKLRKKTGDKPIEQIIAQNMEQALAILAERRIIDPWLVHDVLLLSDSLDYRNEGQAYLIALQGDYTVAANTFSHFYEHTPPEEARKKSFYNKMWGLFSTVSGKSMAELTAYLTKEEAFMQKYGFTEAEKAIYKFFIGHIKPNPTKRKPK